MQQLHDLLNRLLTALWQTIVFCGPMWFLFVAIMITLIVTFIYLSFRDEARHASLSRKFDRPVPPGKSVVFDQEQLPAWTPAAPEPPAARHRLLRYDRRQRATARRSIA